MTRRVCVGNPRLHVARKSALDAVKSEADTYAANVLPIIREAQKAGARTLREIAEALNARGIATARGGKWYAQSVANVLARLGITFRPSWILWGRKCRPFVCSSNRVAFRSKQTLNGRSARLVQSRMTLNGNRASPDRIHKISLNVVCDKERGLLPKSRGRSPHGVKLKNPVSPSKDVQWTQPFRDEHAARAIP
jgi:hypothetical protein